MWDPDIKCMCTYISVHIHEHKNVTAIKGPWGVAKGRRGRERDDGGNMTKYMSRKVAQGNPLKAVENRGEGK
jgi:hypothetical protein